MDWRIEKWLYDVRLSIEEIEGYFETRDRDFNKFCADRLLKRGIERNLEIIGEAVNRILTRDPEFPIDNARKIVGLRNHIIHSYDNISNATVWAIVMNNLPELKKEIDRLLE